MPICSYPDCNSFSAKKSDRCDAHQLAKGKAAAKQESQELKRIRLEQELAAKNAAEREARDAKAQAAAEKERARRAQQAGAIERLKAEWSGQISAVETAVLALRVANPGANAGNNPGGNTLGGVANPVVLTITGPAFGVEKRDVLYLISGFDSSDSGMYKFRRLDPPNKPILIHAQ